MSVGPLGIVEAASVGAAAAWKVEMTTAEVEVVV